MEKTVLHYEILEKLGQGGMGVVYKAFDTRLKRPVALKFLAETLIPDPESKARFIHEAQAASKLDHPNICTIHEIEESSDGQMFICMSWCDGETLQQKIKEGAVETADALDTAIQVADGLEEAHAAGIVHRDIKPSNIMLSSRGQARIMDFGLAKLADASRLTKSAATVGTVQYMSPEQVKGEAIDRRTDIWSLGVVLYEMLTGRLPFGGDYEATVLYAIVNENYEPPSKVGGAGLTGIDTIVARALRKNPHDRYASAREMQQDLIEARRKIAGAKASSKIQPRRVTRKGFTKRIALLGAAVAVLFLASAFVVGRFFGGAAQSVTVAVLGLGGAYPDTSSTGVLAEYLSDNLRKCPNVRVISADTLLELCKLQGIDSVSGANGFTLCRQAQAQYLIRFWQARAAEDIRLGALVYDVARQGLLFEKGVQGSERGNRFTMIEGLADSLGGRFQSLPRWEWPRRKRPRSSEPGIFTEGENIYRGGDPQRGIPLIETAVVLDSTLVPAYERLALWYEYAGDREHARLCAQKAKKYACSRGAGLECMKSQITEYRVNGQYRRAVEYMNSYLSQEPRDAQMCLRLGYVLYHDLKEYAEAIDCLKKVFQLDPGDNAGCWAGAYNSLGNAFLYAGQIDSAFVSFRNSELEKPGADAITSIANAYRLSGSYAEAMGEYDRARRVDRDFFVTYSELGSTCFAIGKWRAAINSFETYVKKAPATMAASGHVLIGTVWFAQEDYGKAGREIDMALELDSLSLQARWLRGRVALEDSRNPAAARRELRAMKKILQKMGPSADEAYYHDLWGWILLTERNYGRGIEEFSEAIRVSPPRNERYFRKEFAAACVKAGRMREAIDEGLGLLALNGKDAEALSILARAYERLGQRDQAHLYLERARAVWREAEPGFRPLEAIRV